MGYRVARSEPNPRSEALSTISPIAYVPSLARGANRIGFTGGFRTCPIASSLQPIPSSLMDGGFYDLDRDGLVAWAGSRGLPAYRGRQLFDFLHRRVPDRFADCTELPAGLRAELDALGPPAPAREVTREESRDGTVKSLLALRDGRRVECVSIPTAERHTVCVSTQVGCAVACTFCASGLRGVERDCTVGEIVYQVLHHHRRRPVTNVVYMGSGEPMFNYPRVLTSLRILVDPHGLGLGRRRFTVSTSGVPDGIRQLAEDEPQVTLALSLHAADDATRDRLVPLNRRWPLSTIMAAMDDYAAATNRRITLEYVCLADANLAPVHARSLAALAREHRAHVNLIPFNAVSGTPHRPPTHDQVLSFHATLGEYGVNATVRGQRGADIAAACGQLALKK